MVRYTSEPATVLIDFDTQTRVVSFWHETNLPDDSIIRKQLPALTAPMLGLWWTDPTKYSVEGYDDALHAIRRVFEAREWLIKVAKGAARCPGDGRLQRSTVTESLHIASVIKASGEPLAAFNRGTFVFSTKAARIAAQIELTENSKIPGRTLDTEGVDPCVDWMLAALKYRDWLGRLVRQKDCVPLIEKRDGERVLRIRADMPKTLRREFTRRF